MHRREQGALHLPANSTLLQVWAKVSATIRTDKGRVVIQSVGAPFRLSWLKTASRAGALGLETQCQACS